MGRDGPIAGGVVQGTAKHRYRTAKLGIHAEFATPLAHFAAGSTPIGRRRHSHRPQAALASGAGGTPIGRRHSFGRHAAGHVQREDVRAGRHPAESAITNSVVAMPARPVGSPMPARRTILVAALRMAALRMAALSSPVGLQGPKAGCVDYQSPDRARASRQLAAGMLRPGDRFPRRSVPCWGALSPGSSLHGRTARPEAAPKAWRRPESLRPALRSMVPAARQQPRRLCGHSGMPNNSASTAAR